jgi:hypothetical protein
VIEAGEASGIVTALDSVGAAAAGASVFLLQAAEKTVKRTIIVLSTGYRKCDPSLT